MLGYEQAPVNQVEFDDGYIRTFRSNEFPDLCDDEVDLMRDMSTDEIYIYLSSPTFRHRCSDEIAGFVIRELMRGNL